MSSNRGKMLRARRRGLGSIVKLAASASARSSSRSMLSSSSRNGFSGDGADACHSCRRIPLIGSCGCRRSLQRCMRPPREALVRAEGRARPQGSGKHDPHYTCIVDTVTPNCPPPYSSRHNRKTVRAEAANRRRRKRESTGARSVSLLSFSEGHDAEPKGGFVHLLALRGLRSDVECRATSGVQPLRLRRALR